MNAIDVIIDLMDDNRRRLHRLFPEISDDCLYWAPDPGGNSIAVTVWHMGRLFDVFITQHTKGDYADKECWIVNGWAESCAYDPRGIGRDGWGSVNGYSREEVASIPYLTVEQLLDYFDEVQDAVKVYLGSSSIEELLQAAPGFERRYSKYQVIQMALMDNARHLGEIFALKAMWERANESVGH